MDFATTDPIEDAAASSVQDDEQDFGHIMPPCTIAFDYHNKTLGMAYYKADTRSLFMASDLHEIPPFNHWQTAGLSIAPDHVLISSRANDTLYDEKGHHVVLKNPEIRPRSEFSDKHGLEKLVTIFQAAGYYDSETDVVHDTRHSARVKLRGVLDCDSVLSLGCINVLLSFIQTRRQFNDMTRDDFLKSMVMSIDMFKLPYIMLLNADTFYALKIFETKKKSKVAGKMSYENLTLFSLLDSCATSQGKALLKHWFLTPSTDPNVLAARHDTIECFLLPRNIAPAGKIMKVLRKCSDMIRAMDQLQQGLYGSSTGGVWQAVLNFALNAIKIADLTREMSNISDISSIVQMRNANVISSLEAVAGLIHDVIDFDESEVEGRIVVKRLVDDMLDDRKDAYDGIAQTLSQVEQEMSKILPDEFAELVRCLYIPQLGFHITMPIGEYRNPVSGATAPPIYQSPLWEAKFCSSDQWYFKSDRMMELDEYYGDLHSLVVDREIELLHQLQTRVLESSPMLISTSNATAELDSLLALADAARKHNYVKPEMTLDNVLRIEGGRHPLLEHLVELFVPNDLECGGYDVDEISMAAETIPNAIIMTGANYSGKSVYLKLTALIVYMAHIGSFVPASSALIGITDRILTRLASRNTVAKAESAFLSDLQQVSYALRMLTPRSLVLIDEFGKASDEDSGPSLFGGLVAYLTDPTHMRPRTLLTTHFHKIVCPKYLPPHEDAYVLKHMQIMIDPKLTNLSDQITYLFKVADGPSNSSFGIHCAALAGMPQEILDRAQQFLEIQARGESLEDALIVLTEEEKEDLKQAEALAKRFLDWDMEAEPDENVMSKLREIVLGETEPASQALRVESSPSC